MVALSKVLFVAAAAVQGASALRLKKVPAFLRKAGASRGVSCEDLCSRETAELQQACNEGCKEEVAGACPDGDEECKALVMDGLKCVQGKVHEEMDGKIGTHEVPSIQRGKLYEVECMCEKACVANDPQNTLANGCMVECGSAVENFCPKHSFPCMKKAFEVVTCIAGKVAKGTSADAETYKQECMKEAGVEDAKRPC